MPNAFETNMRVLPSKRVEKRSAPASAVVGPVLPKCAAASIEWPELTSLGLNDQQLEARKLGVGGSDANIILSGDPERIHKLWLEKRGGLATDLSANLAVALGKWTEEFNRQWFERVTGFKVGSTGVALVCAELAWRRCNLDGMIQAEDAAWEAKHTNAFAKPDEVLERYMPQLQHNMAVARVDRIFLSVIFGNQKFEIFEVESDWLYQRELLDAEIAFWIAVQRGEEPTAAPTPLPPKAVGTREICMEGRNAWAAAASDWLAHRDAAKIHAIACAEIKTLVESDVSRAFGHGIEAKRSKSGAVSIKEFAS